MTDDVRYGIIGAGLMGLEHQRNLAALPGAVVTAVADPHEPSRRHALALAGDAPLQTFADYRALLDAELCDAYVIASPNDTHHDVVRDVLEIGRHVLCEKPLCTTAADARDLVSWTADYSAVFWVGLEYRYMPPVAAVIESVRAGAVGTVRMIAVREHRFPFLRKVDDWNRFNRRTGGTLVEKCCHFFDLQRQLAQANPVRVMASGAQDVNHLDERYDGATPDIMDNAMVIVEFANGIRASLDLCMFAEGSTNAEELSVVGDEGKVEAFLPSGLVRTGRRDSGAPGVREAPVTDERVRVEGYHHGASYLEHLDFLDAVRQGTPAKVTATDGLWSVLVGIAAQRSIDEQRVVSLDEL